MEKIFSFDVVIEVSGFDDVDTAMDALQLWLDTNKMNDGMSSEVQCGYDITKESDE